MNKTKILISALIVVFSAGLATAPAKATYTNDTPTSAVSSIILKTADNVGQIVWSPEGFSSQGFKVVWSKNENPTYPCRENDKYHYYSNTDQRQDTLEAFAGAGTYYVRVCEYLGGKCGKYSNQVSVQLGSAVACTMEYAPVCGSDGKAYSNKCAAKAAGVVVKKEGECGTEKEPETIVKKITSIVLKGEGNNIYWKADGYGAQGFKVVYSKTSGPTYPLRDGDRYDYKSNPNSNSDFVSPYFGAGTYYVRVCEYLGGKCGVYSNEIKIELGSPEAKPVVEIEKIRENAGNLYANKIDQLLAEIKTLRDIVKEQQVQINHLMKLKEGLAQNISTAVESAIKNFISYGVDNNTKKLGEGERAAVMYSFKEAYNKLPETQDEIEEAIKIANGRFPSIVSEEAEANAKIHFKKIYLREPDMSNAHDVAAIKVMAYGLRQKAENRNLKSEAAAIKTFKAIFKKLPSTTEEWNTLQAITYSGATR